MKHLETFNEFEIENEGLKSWGVGIMAALSLFASTAMGGNIKVKGEAKSQDMNLAIKKAKSDARLKVIDQLGGGGSSAYTSIKGGQYGEPKVIKDANGYYVATIEYTVDEDNIDTKQMRSEIFDGQKTKSFCSEVVGMGYTGENMEEINDFIDQYSDTYNFKVSKMTTEEANEVGEMSIKLSNKAGTVFCVVTPIGKTPSISSGASARTGAGF